MEQIQYYFKLALRYFGTNKTRTIYSVIGIMIPYILCYYVFTIGYSCWSYGLQDAYYEVTMSDRPVQLKISLSGEDKNELDSIIPWPWRYEKIEKEQIESLRKMETDPAVSELIIHQEGMYSNPYVTVDEMRAEESYAVYISLKDLSNLKKSASELGEKYQMDIWVLENVEVFLNQGDSLMRYALRAVITLVAAFVSLFSILILRNTLLVAVIERMRDYGLFRCVGMSKKQLFHVLLAEGILLEVCAVVPGTVIGYGILKLLEPWLNQVFMLNVPFSFHFYPSALFYCFLFVLVVILLSLFEPARQAMHLTPADAIRRNIVLVRKSGAIKEKIRRTKAGLWGKLFGIEGEYARKNTKRNRARYAAYFLAVLLCTLMLGTAQTVLDSVEATYANRLNGKRQEYQETIIVDGNYDIEKVNQIRCELEEFSDVEQTWSFLMKRESLDWLGDIDKKFKDADRKFFEQSEGHCCYFAYDQSHMEQLKDYLLEGTINYSEMVEKNEVLLLDLQHKVSDGSTDFKEKDIRKTDYKVGDTITILDIQGQKRIYTISGIISEDIFNGTLRYGEVALIYPQECAVREQQESAWGDFVDQEGESHFSDAWKWEIGITRNNRLPDREIEQYCNERGYYYDGGFSIFYDTSWDNMVLNLQTFHVVCAAVKLIGFLIGIIVLIQMTNTLHANLAVRRKELRLYSDVGMSRKQMIKMLLLEHAADIGIAILIGYLFSWGFSWYVIEYVMNQDGSIKYVFSWREMVPIVLIAYGLLIGIILFSVRGRRRGQ